MYGQLKEKVAAVLGRSRLLKPQTERQIPHYLDGHDANLASFMRCAADLLEDYELDILFGPQFTPSFDDRVEVAGLLYHWKPTGGDLEKLVKDLGEEMSHTMVLLPDGTETELALHEVMIERFVRLLRLEYAPDPVTATALRDALPAELWPAAIALASQRGFTSEKQAWLATFVNHMANRHEVCSEMLETVSDFAARQPSLEQPDLLAAAESLLNAVQGTAAFALQGHQYWSPDVAQHHQYRGQGKIDRERIELQQSELTRVRTMTEDLRTFSDGWAEGV